MSDATPVASSATPSEQTAPLSPVEQAVADGDYAHFRDVRQAQRSHRAMPVSSSADEPAGAAPDKPVEQAGERPVSDKPASEPGKTGHKGNADSRIQELLAERAQLRRELEQLRQPPRIETPQAASSPAPSATTGPREPQLSDFEADPVAYPDPYAAFMDARAEWRARQVLREEREAEKREAAQRDRAAAEERRIDGFRSRVGEAVKADAGFWDGVSDEVKGLKPSAAALLSQEPITVDHVIADALLESDQAPALMRHWSEHPDALAELRAAQSPRELHRRFARQEARLETPTPRPDPPKTVTSAPPPPTTLGHRPSEPADPVDAAIRNDSYEAFRRAKLAQRVANLR